MLDLQQGDCLELMRSIPDGRELDVLKSGYGFTARVQVDKNTTYTSFFDD